MTKFIRIPPEVLKRGKEYIFTHVSWNAKQNTLEELVPSYSFKHIHSHMVENYGLWVSWQKSIGITVESCIPMHTDEMCFIKRAFYLGKDRYGYHRVCQERRIRSKSVVFNPHMNETVIKLESFADREWDAWIDIEDSPSITLSVAHPLTECDSVPNLTTESVAHSSAEPIPKNSSLTDHDRE